jgi:hypothetical protein
MALADAVEEGEGREMNQRIRDRISIFCHGYPDQSQFTPPAQTDEWGAAFVAPNELCFLEPMRYNRTKRYYCDVFGRFWTHEHLQMRYGEI